MEYIVYFADKSVIFTAKQHSSASAILDVESGADVSRAKVLKILETHKTLIVLSINPDVAFAAFAAEFAMVEAAGGIVVNPRGEWLMICRNGRWDLPKGHLERFETLEECAVREVEEETGIRSQVTRRLCETLHAYNLYGKWELKCTHWYALSTDACAQPVPQTEEGIERVVWCAREQVRENLLDAFPTIRRVAECMAE